MQCRMDREVTNHTNMITTCGYRSFELIIQSSMALLNDPIETNV